MDYYALLEVPETASQEQIRSAYIKQSLQWHPDRNTSEEATQRFQQVSEAYYVLSDPARRKEYNASHKKAANVDAQKVFSTVFDDLMIPEVPNPVWFWQPIGAAAGVCLGFIVFNIPGSIAGYYMGSKMGKVRDMKGKCVYDAFIALPSNRRREILTSLATKFFASAISA